jgi:hypothetical protein
MPLRRHFIRQMAKNGLTQIQMFQHVSFKCALRATKKAASHQME